MRQQIRIGAALVAVFMTAASCTSSGQTGQATTTSAAATTTTAAPLPSTTVPLSTTAPTTIRAPATTTPPATGAAPLPPAPAGGNSPLTSPSGHLYRAGEFCPAADLNVTTTGSDGTITCEVVNGYDRWVKG